MIAEEAEQRLRILRLLVNIGETSAPYNQFSLPLVYQQNITLCTYFKTFESVPEQITLFAGDGSSRGFFRALKATLDKRTYDIVHAHSPHVGALFLVANLIYRGRLQATVYTVHNSYQSYNLRNKLLLLPIFASFRRVVFCSNASLQSFPKIFKILGSDRARVVQNGLDIARVDQVLEDGSVFSNKDSFTVISVGQLIQRKNPQVLIRAFHYLGNRVGELVFIGDGDLRASLRQECNDLGLGNRVKLMGLMPRDGVYKCFGRADLFVSASRSEGLPIAVLEAMACRCPVVLSDIPPHREITEGVDSIPLIQPDNVFGFANAIEQFRAMTPVERADIGEKCRKLVERRFSLTAMLGKYEELYNQLSGNTPEVAQRYAR
jgi:glycosyltransferase involved in cell wall biosynthesis